MKEKITKKLDTKFFRFLFVGILNTAFGYSMYALFIFLDFHYSLAVLCSTILGVLFNFKTIGVLVFKNNNNKLIHKFLAVYALNYLINISFLKLFKTFGWENMYINGLILVLPLALLSFILNKKFVFERGSDENLSN